MANFQNTNPNRQNNQTGSSTKTNVSTSGKKQQQKPGKTGGNKQQGKDDCNC